MATDFTTISVHPPRASELREYRDTHNHPSLDAALDELLSQRGE
jgi:hypothetical protein